MQRRSNKPQRSHRLVYHGLDRVIPERARLGVLTSLVAHPKGLKFADLKDLYGLIDGDLSQRLQVLEGAILVETSKSFKDNRPQTLCRITPKGRRRYLNYGAVLQQVVADATAAVKTDSCGNAAS
jgi:DNA-binding MarR family transcriptional regulator